MALKLAILDDMALLERYRLNGDELAFAHIVRRHRSPVYATCVRVLCDRALAEDAVQETFFRLMRRPAAVSRSLGGWLHRAATQLSIDLLRSESARRRREAAYERQRAEQPMRWCDLSPIVDRCLEELPASTRELLIDHFLEGVTQKEIAGKLAVSESTVSRHMYEALEKLRKKLKSKGVAFTIGGLTGLLMAHAVEAAPMALCTQLGRMALASGLGSGTGGATFVGSGAGSSVGGSGGDGGGAGGGSGAASNGAVIKSATLIAVLVALTVIAASLVVRLSDMPVRTVGEFEPDAEPIACCPREGASDGS